jgi:DNA-binding SARP family transcriptional activator
LKDAQDALKEHLSRLVEREESIRKRYEEMVESYERA